jgi:hypothetical protein
MVTNAKGHGWWLRFVESQHWERGNLDQASYFTFLRAGSLGISPEEAISGVAARIRAAGDHPKMGKLKAQLRRAYTFARGQGEQLGGYYRLVPKAEPTWPAPDLAAINQIVSGGPGLCDLWESSPVQFGDSDSHTEQIVDILFPGNPLLCVGKSNHEFATRRREVWRGRLASLPLIVPNPMLSVTGQTQDGRQSEHTKSATAKPVYQVVEFDFSEQDKNGKETLWAPLVRKWRSSQTELADACASLILYLREQLPTLVCACHSGRRSLHGWFRVFELTPAARKAFMKRAVALGADRATWVESQFVRIPDGLRDSDRRQTCYLLDPNEGVKA